MAQTQTPILGEIGLSGLKRSGGYIFEEILPHLTGDRWMRTVREMREDPIVNAVLFAIEMFCRQTSLDVVAAGEDTQSLADADFITGCLDDMSQTRQEIISEALTMLQFGFSYLEVVYKERRGSSLDSTKNSQFNDGRIGWRKWAPRAQESMTNWEFDESGGIQAMVQQPAPDYVVRSIPIAKSLHFRTTAHKNNPEGRSVLRAAYRPWFFKKNIENIEAIGIERDLAGFPVMRIPGEIITSTDPAKIAIVNAYKVALTNIRRNEMEGLLLPSDVVGDGSVRQYEFELLSSGGERQFDTDKVIQRYDQRIAICVLADFILLGHTQKAGSYGMTTAKGDLFSTAIGAFLDSFTDVVNRHAIPRLLRLNGRTPDQLPKLVHGPVEDVDLAQLGSYIAQLAGANFTFTPEEVKYLKEMAGLPVQDGDQGHEQAADTEPKQPDPSQPEDPAEKKVEPQKK